jgi:type IV pilus assembly protein PilA
MGAAIVMLALAACQKKDAAQVTGGAISPKAQTVGIVGEKERSKSFLAVHQHLELGGTLYGYVDVDGDMLKIAKGLQSIVTETAKSQPDAVPFAEQDYAAIATMLGLTDVKAVGVSSVPDGTGYYRNRMFLHTGGERHGLIAGLGGKPGPFRHVELAPADTTFFGETEVDLGVMYRTIQDVVAKVGGEPAGNQFELAIKNAGEIVALSLVDLIFGLKGRSAAVLRLDAEHPVRVDSQPAVMVPGISLVVCIEGVGPVVEAAMTQSRLFRRTETTAAMRSYDFLRTMPVAGMRPILVVDGTTLYFATSRKFFDECHARKGGLAKSAEFQRAMNQVGTQGNGLTYLSPKFFEQARQFEKMNPGLSPREKSVIAVALGQIPPASHPLVAVRSNLDDGILIRSYLNRSLKQEMVGVAVYNPVTVGIVAAMAIPAFQKVRSASQDKAVLSNLRLLAAAAEQHYLETGTRTATYDELVGPTRYIKAVQPVAGEDYRAIHFAQGQPLRVRLANGRAIEYSH